MPMTLAYIWHTPVEMELPHGTYVENVGKCLIPMGIGGK